MWCLQQPGANGKPQKDIWRFLRQWCRVYAKKICATGHYRATTYSLKECCWAFVGVTTGLGVVTYLTFLKGIPVLVASLAATACLIFVAPNAPAAQPRNVLCGQVMSAGVGVIIYHLGDSSWYVAALGAGLSVVAMMATRTLHPPAAATAVIAVITQPGWLFPLLPVAVGAAILIVAGVVINNLILVRRYPYYWW